MPGYQINEVTIENNVLNFYGRNLFGDQIPILGWAGIPPEYSTTERYKEMADAGFTIDLPWQLCYNDSYLSGDPQTYFTALDAAQANGMKVMVGAGVLDAFSPANRAKLLMHPALAGYAMKDEPSATQFDDLGTWVKRVQAIDNVHPCHINLFPNGASSSQLGTSNYTDYVQSYIAKVPIPFISFDKYPITLSGSTRSLASDFYANLEIISSEAQKAGKPFWAFALSTEHNSYPRPTLADLRLQIYSNLAYGAQGIQYFTYWHALENDYALIDANGNRTDSYNIVKEMNQEIKGRSKVFLNSNVLWTAHTGTVPLGCTALNTSNVLNGIITSFNISGGSGALVSRLENGSDNYLVVVNHGINSNITITVTGTSALKCVQKDGTFVANTSSAETLTPGDAIIYTWQ